MVSNEKSAKQVLVLNARAIDDPPQDNNGFLLDSEYKEYRKLKVTSTTAVSSSFLQSGNSSICFPQSLFFGS